MSPLRLCLLGSCLVLVFFWSLCLTGHGLTLDFDYVGSNTNGKWGSLQPPARDSSQSVLNSQPQASNRSKYFSDSDDVAPLALVLKSQLSSRSTEYQAMLKSNEGTKWPPADKHNPEKSNQYPLGAAKHYPAQWLVRHSEEDLDASAKNASRWAAAAKSMMQFAWAGYRERAWGADDIHPVSGTGTNWAGLAVTLIESLDTLYLMGMQDEFSEAEAWVRTKLDFSKCSDEFHSFFELTIRALGGLLGAHSLSGRKVFLDKAYELGKRLLAARDPSQRYPRALINLRRGVAQQETHNTYKVGLADISSYQVEFRYLSHRTGDPQFMRAADNTWRYILHATPRVGLLPVYFDTQKGIPFGQEVSLGAHGDSFYEYLLKGFLQTGLTETQLFKKWKLAMDQMIQQLLRTSEDNFLYISKARC
eukprot:gnl/MRDRNA2_/MRDRNA2_77092_c0_seq1.p1 gnl/MRDRNA2_/MRDRNA2_77092_c0~~gnl/MRDRNA2_/MRDRNA2_77092_c0_seq1.p1  ORF type:complete len:419 (-),score=66.43 gnl/MRDRNA2_/MRDRNA2_77092_c0_seq1:539-1795(-)